MSKLSSQNQIRKMNNSWLAWYADMGVEELYIPHSPQANMVAQANQASSIVASTESVEEDVASGFALSTELKQVRADLLAKASAENCPLQKSAKHFLFHRGDYRSQLFIVTDTPSNVDDVNGEILSGGDGELLVNMLRAIGLKIDIDCYIAPIIPFRSAGNRPIVENEWQRYRVFIHRQLQSLQPKVVLVLGKESLQQLLPQQSLRKSILKLNNVVMEADDLPNIKLLPIFHPRFLLSSQKHKPLAWEAMKTLEKLL